MATYENSFKEEAVRLSDDIGVKQAAAQLGIPYWTLADWRAARKAKGSQAFVGSGHKRLPTDEKERRILELEKENADLKRANEILKDALHTDVKVFLCQCTALHFVHDVLDLRFSSWFHQVIACLNLGSCVA